MAGEDTDALLRLLAAAPKASPPRVLHEGVRVGHYEVLSRLGAGGMGVVYRAHDARLGRDVALKFPTETRFDSRSRARFRREAQLASAVSHPNVVALFDVGEHDDLPYLVTELLEGATLRELISAGPLPWSKAAALAGQVAEGLAAAHAKGIVHRDLKPDNLFITDEGRLKILDFGIAKLLDPIGAETVARTTHTARSSDDLPAIPIDAREGDARESSAPLTPHTAAGAVLGTAGYMSPEQVLGQPADQRSDLFGLGAILHEMLTGRRAFARGSRAETDNAILGEQPPDLPPSVPRRLDRIVWKCLEKDPGKRFRDARELAGELARVPGGAPLLRSWRLAAGVALLVASAGVALQLQRGPATAPTRITVAAADFVNETKEEELDGLSGMLITSLEQSRRLSVLPRGRMFDVLKQLGRADAERIDEHLGRQICKQANVDALVLASIRRLGELYVIDLKVLDPAKDEYLFAASEQGKGKESIPGLIDRLSERTRNGLKERAEEIRSSSVAIAQATTANLEAYQHYFQGEQFWARGQVEKAMVEFRTAVRLDPGFGLAHFALGGALDGQRDRPKMVEELETALRLGLPEPERCVADAELAGSRGDGDRALRLIDGCAARFTQDKSVLYAAAGWQNLNPAGAAPLLEKVVAIDPTFQPAVGDLIEAWQEQGRTDKALERAKDYAARVNDVDARVQLAAAQLFAGQRAPAFETLRDAAHVFPQSARPAFELARASLFSGEPEAALAELKPVLEGRFAEAGPDAPRSARILLDVYGGRFKSAAASFEVDIARARETGSVLALGWALFWKGILSAQGSGDLAAARRIAAELETLDVAADSPFLLDCAIGDFDRAAAIAATRPAYLFDLQPYCDAQRARTRGALAEAIERFEKLAPILSHGDQARYLLIELNLAAGEPHKALAAARRLQTTYRTEPAAYLFFLLWYPRSFYRLGQVYERLGDSPAALKSYERFLMLWKDADPDLEELRDANARVAALRPIVR